MRIAYLGQMADVSGENGISKKIRGQTVPWLRRGHQVRYFSLVPTTAVWSGLTPLETELVTRGRFGLRLWRSLALARRIRTWQPDVIYFRYAYHSAGLPALFRAVPTVAELNSDDLTEYPITLSPAKVAYHRVTRNRVLRSVAAFAPVTHELALRFAHFGRPTKVIANGIALEDFPEAAAPAPATGVRLLFIGQSGSPWHGIERVAELALMFPDAVFDLVGCTTGDWQCSVGTTPPPSNLRLHGMLPRERYEPLLCRATAAIGTMALYRKKMDEACPLKVREYLALGLPVIGAYRDTDIPEGSDYFLRLPNDGAPLAPHRDAIAGWLSRWQGRRVPRKAIQHLDHDGKEAQRLAFLARIAGVSKIP
ncbi:MAG: glycosyltransferase [Opitutaceae bacterium]|nr:glycosyltransferase [Opitutaceae bacterium]